VEYHANRHAIVAQALREDMASLAPELLADGTAQQDYLANATDKPSAQKAARQAVCKTIAEAPLIAAISPDVDALRNQGDDFWQAIAAAHAHEARLDEASIALIHRENPSAREAGARAAAKAPAERPLLALIRTFEEAMATDAVKNEYTLHHQIHVWFARGEAPADVDELNERVYAELFLTPSSDPWLGLAPQDAYTALDGGGLSSTP
jgi:hypothetical protein